jgi:tripeptidyl-peptidase-1
MFFSWSIPFILFLHAIGISARRLHQIPPGGRSHWSRGKEAAPDQVVSITIGLTLQSSQSGIAALQGISDPASANYGKTWSPQEVVEAFKPDAKNVASVLRWLQDSQTKILRAQQSHDGGYLALEMSVADASRLLNTSFHQFSGRAAPGQRRVPDDKISCDDYVVPESIFPLIDYISAIGTVEATSRVEDVVEGPPQPRIASPAAANVSCSRFNAPTCLRQRYKIPERQVEPHPNNSLAVFQQAWVTWLEDDLDMFFELFDPSLVSPTNTLHLQLLTSETGRHASQYRSRQWRFHAGPIPGVAVQPRAQPGL